MTIIYLQNKSDNCYLHTCLTESWTSNGTCDKIVNNFRDSKNYIYTWSISSFRYLIINTNGANVPKDKYLDVIFSLV